MSTVTHVYTCARVVCVHVHVCSMKDGRLLKPTHPAMSLDSTFLRRTFGNKGPDGQMTAAFTEVQQQQ